MQHFVEHDPNRPNIALKRIAIAFQSFWTHIERSAYIIA